jgi:hypothetical protein
MTTSHIKLASVGARMHDRAEAIARVCRLLDGDPLRASSKAVLGLLFPLVDTSALDDCDLALVETLPATMGVDALGGERRRLNVLSRHSRQPAFDANEPRRVAVIALFVIADVGVVEWKNKEGGWEQRTKHVPDLSDLDVGFVGHEWSGSGGELVDPADADERIVLVRSPGPSGLQRRSILPF